MPLEARKSPKCSQNRCKSANLILPARSRYPLQLRWRPLAAAEAGAAASGAAGMPVRRPRRPTAVSAAFEADAGPELGCAGQLERAAEAPNGEVSSLWVGLSVSRSGARSGLVEVLISKLGLLCLGSSSGFGVLGLVNHRNRNFGRLGSSSRLSVGLRRCWCV